MYSFEELLGKVQAKFKGKVFPEQPENLYRPANYILQLGGKRIRPILCLMGQELFAPINEETYHAAMALEIFHNFTLIHDDIMDEAPLRRGKPTVHQKYGSSVALLSGDVMFVQAYNYLNKVALKESKKGQLFDLFNKTAREVCEGQQLDMDLENQTLEDLDMKDYIHMISLKTSVLLAASLQIGALIGGADDYSQKMIYSFGKNMGLAFQIQDDYLDAFGNPEKFGKQIGGDIQSNKKTFLLIKAFQEANSAEKKEMIALLNGQNNKNKISQMLTIFKACEVDYWAEKKKESFIQMAEEDLQQVEVGEDKKGELQKLMHRLLHREN